MILTCPACETRYNVADEAVSSAAGRQVRCANCGHIWHFATALQENLPLEPVRVAGATPGIVPPLAVSRAAVAAGATAEADTTDSLLELGTVTTPAVAPLHVRRSLVRLVALLSVFAALLLLILARHAVIRVWPETAAVYGAVGLYTEASAFDLKVTPTRTGEDFIVAAEITNITDAARPVPRLRVALLDGSHNELDVKIVEADVSRLAPGAITRVRTVFEHPSITANDVEVTFAAE
jgi:predicted Zn finger-like uncharacterized protein